MIYDELYTRDNLADLAMKLCSAASAVHVCGRPFRIDSADETHFLVLLVRHPQFASQFVIDFQRLHFPLLPFRYKMVCIRVAVALKNQCFCFFLIFQHPILPDVATETRFLQQRRRSWNAFGLAWNLNKSFFQNLRKIVVIYVSDGM